MINEKTLKRRLYKVCVVTAARSEYGLLRWVIDELMRDEQCCLQLVVTGSHLVAAHGETWRDIEQDGYSIMRMIDMCLETTSQKDIVHSMGRCMTGMATAFGELQPDLVVVLGDRYELLAICSAALVMGIPIAHISGGDVTEGAIDNEIRNAITMMATLHFPGVQDSAENIIRMRGNSHNVWAVGEPGLDNFRRLSLLDRTQLAESLSLPLSGRWIMLTLHPETQRALTYNLQMASRIIDALQTLEEDVVVVITKANADFGGSQLNDFFESVTLQNPVRFRLFSSLGQLRYLSFLKECYCVMGNSSSGIVEAPCLGIPVINVGDRQEGRHLCRNVISVPNDRDSIAMALQKVSTMTRGEVDSYYGDGYASERIVRRIKGFLRGKGEK